MRVISKARLRQFWQMPGYQDAEGPLRARYMNVNSRTVVGSRGGTSKRIFGSASLVGSCAVFNIGGNNYRLVHASCFPARRSSFRVMSHAEYDAGKWKDECGCSPPPRRRISDTPRRKPKNGDQWP